MNDIKPVRNDINFNENDMIKFYENDIKFPKNDILRCSVPTFAQNIWVEIFLDSIF